MLADLGAEESCSQAVEQAVGNFGKLDALVNNAGVNDKVGLEHGNPNDYLGSLQRNLVQYYSMAHYALPHLKGSKGSIVSQFMTLLPGDVISTGTPAEVGLGVTPPQYLKVGDIVELGIERLGESRQLAVNFSEEQYNSTAV